MVMEDDVQPGTERGSPWARAVPSAVGASTCSTVKPQLWALRWALLPASRLPQCLWLLPVPRSPPQHPLAPSVLTVPPYCLPS